MDTEIDLSKAYARVRAELARTIVGMDDVIELLAAAVFSGGHALLIGVPGLAKTLLVSSLARLLDMKFSRIQFTPDLMPSDISGTEIIIEDKETGERQFRFMAGPVFANILLADEINRTPPKTQAALIEAMEERQISSLGKRFKLDDPFFVLATQNPIEQEGTYPLPAAQLDRFLFNIEVGYPDAQAEEKIMRLTSRTTTDPSSPILSRDEVRTAVAAVRRMDTPGEVAQYATRLARLTRPEDPDAPESVRKYVSFGAGPRGAQSLVLGAKAIALMSGRKSPTHADVRRVLHPTLRHRIVMNFVSAADNMTPDRVINDVQAAVSAPDWSPMKTELKRGFLSRLLKS